MGVSLRTSLSKTPFEKGSSPSEPMTLLLNPISKPPLPCVNSPTMKGKMPKVTGKP